MNAVADRFAGHGVASVFLYSYEAHPGEHYPHLSSMEQKFQHAQALRDEYGVTRRIVADALDGACHRAYGSMPNMTWVFTKGGVPVYKSDWTDSKSVEQALEYFLDVVQRRKAGERLTQFRVERADYRSNDRDRFFESLARNGPKAVEEFKRFMAG